MTTPPVPGTSYHRLARTARHSWWRPPLGTLLIAAGVFLLGCGLLLAAEVLGQLTGQPTGPDGLRVFGDIPDAALTILFIAAALPVTLFAAWAVQRRPPGTLSSVTGRLRWRWLAVCLLVAVPALGLLLLGSWALAGLSGDDAYLSGPGWVGWSRFLAGLTMVLLLVPVQAAAEEYVFRGWLLQGVGAYLRNPWAAIVVQAVLFAAAHGWGTPWGFAGLTVMGVATGWLTVRTGGLEAAIALHVVNNVVAFGISAWSGTLNADETMADAPWQLAVVDAVMIVTFVLVVRWLAGRRGVAVTTPPTPPPYPTQWPVQAPGPVPPWPVPAPGLMPAGFGPAPGLMPAGFGPAPGLVPAPGPAAGLGPVPGAAGPANATAQSRRPDNGNDGSASDAPVSY